MARSGGINTVDVASEDALSGKAPVAEHYASRGETVSYDYDRGGQLFRMYNEQWAGMQLSGQR